MVDGGGQNANRIFNKLADWWVTNIKYDCDLMNYNFSKIYEWIGDDDDKYSNFNWL